MGLIGKPSIIGSLSIQKNPQAPELVSPSRTICQANADEERAIKKQEIKDTQAESLLSGDSKKHMLGIYIILYIIYNI